jgi:hypothetical protein
VAVLAEALRNQEAAHQQKEDDPGKENACKPEEVPCIFEFIHIKPSCAPKSSINQAFESTSAAIPEA